LDLLCVSSKSLLHVHTPKASILFLSAFFIVQLSLPLVATGKGGYYVKSTFSSFISCYYVIPSLNTCLECCLGSFTYF
uniref:Uncharacterized protein n=1 Tax=Neogobius melanostomus TaxID=47308 RepID=A0A8C6U0W0_9GOBI